jgi:hypothetical protein
MQELGHLIEELSNPLGVLFMFLIFAVMFASFAVSVPRLLHRENHHFA